MADQPTYEQLRQRVQELEQVLVDLGQTKELLLQEKRFSDATLDSLPGVFYMFDPTGRFVRWNDNFRDVSGYSDEEISRMHPLDFVTQEYRETIASKIQETFAKGKVLVEADLLSKNGRKTRHLFTGLRATIGEGVYLIGAGINVVERVTAEEALQKSEGKLQAMLSSINDHMCMMDKDLNILWANKTTKMLFGQDIIGRKCHEVYHGGGEPCLPYP